MTRFTWSEIRRNNWKTVGLFAIFIVLVALLATGVGAVLNNIIAGWLIGAAFIIGYGAFAYYQGSSIALRMHGAHEAEETQYRQLHNIVEELSIAADIDKPAVYIIEDKALNAFATGIRSDDAAVAVTTGMLRKMDREELSGVIAHELAHIKSNDTKMMLLAGVLVGSIIILADIFFRVSLFGGRDNRGQWIYLVIALAAMILAPIVAQLIKLAVSRKREYAADAQAAQITRNPQGLVKALTKLNEESERLSTSTRSLNHLYINSQLDKDSIMDTWFSTHPPLEDRINRLQEL